MSIFSLDSKFMQAMSRMADLMLLNILFLITSIPCFTIGASSAALYSVCFRLGTEREGGILRPYFHAFRENFKQGTLLFVLLFLPAVLMVVNVLFFYSMGGFYQLLSYLFIALLFVVSFVYAYVFPLLSQFRNTIPQTLKNALLLSIGYLPRSIVLVLLNVLPLLILYYIQITFFFQLGFVWIFFYFSTVAYINAQILRKVFAPYQPSEEEAP